MRKISIKKLYGNLSKEMRELPFAVTRGGSVIGYMSLDPPAASLDKNAKIGVPGLDKPKKISENSVSFAGSYSKDRQVGKK